MEKTSPLGIQQHLTPWVHNKISPSGCINISPPGFVPAEISGGPPGRATRSMGPPRPWRKASLSFRVGLNCDHYSAFVFVAGIGRLTSPHAHTCLYTQTDQYTRPYTHIVIATLSINTIASINQHHRLNQSTPSPQPTLFLQNIKNQTKSALSNTHRRHRHQCNTSASR